MGAGVLALEIEQGATWEHTFIWRDENNDIIDLTGYTAEMQLRESHESVTPEETLSTTGGEIVITALAGQIDITLTAVRTGALSGSGVYDLELTDGAGKVTRLVQGVYEISLEVTR